MKASGFLAFWDVFLHREAQEAQVYLPYLTILPLKNSAFTEPSPQEPIISSANQNINWPSSITSTNTTKQWIFYAYDNNN